MPPFYRIAEVLLYSLLNFLPFLALALYPFRRNLRFSPAITGLLIGTLTVIQLALGFWAAFYPNGKSGLISAVSTLLYAAFYFLAIRIHIGKVFFTLLMISNIANFAVIAAKCTEGFLFPALATQSYRLSFSLMLFATELILAIPLFYYIKKFYTPAVEKTPSGFEWRWYYAFYSNGYGTSLEIALRPKNTLFLFAINIGAILIYYIVTQLILEQDKTLALTEQNHQLSMQAIQYENLQERITEARRAKHDVRHHIALMQEYLNHKDYTALEDYLRQYGKSLPDDTLIRFCANPAANAVLLYFAQQAKNNGIDYIVKTEIPAELGIPETDISVLLGNLLENAIEACRAETGEHKKRVT